MVSYYPTQAEQDEYLSTVNMDEAIEKLSDWHKQDVMVAELHPLPNGTFPVEAVHSFAEVASAYNLDFSSQYGNLIINRPKTRKELEEAVITQWRSKRYEENKKAEEEKTDNGD